MKFSVLALTAALVSVVAAIPAQLTPLVDKGIVVDDIREITDKSASLQKIVASITIINISAQGPRVARSLQEIATIGGQAVTDVGTPPQVPFSDADAEEVVEVLKTFVVVHQLLLGTLIGKESFFGQFALTAPIAAALRAIESVVDQLAFGILGLVPTRASEAGDQKNALDAALNQAIRAFEN